MDALRQQVAEDLDQVLVYLDEVTYYRHPTAAQAWAPVGADQPRVERGYRAATTTRVIGALDAQTGRVLVRQAAHIGIAAVVGLYQDLQAAYPAARRIWVVQDNWAIHSHPDVLVALEEQETVFPWYRPRHWGTEPSPAARRRWGDWHLPIQIVPLPTYASWTNPIEKLWRWLKAEVLHHHPWTDDLDQLRQTVLRFLRQFADGSDALLRYVGLGVPT